jgi:hypothetical protein
MATATKTSIRCWSNTSREEVRAPPRKPSVSAVLLPAAVVACRVDRHPVAKIDPQFRCRRDAATAPHALLARGMQRLPPQVRKSDLRPRGVGVQGVAPYRLHACCFARQRQPLCSEAGGLSDRLYRVDCSRLARLEPIVQMEPLRGSCTAFPSRALRQRIALVRHPNVAICGYLSFLRSCDQESAGCGRFLVMTVTVMSSQLPWIDEYRIA